MKTLTGKLASGQRAYALICDEYVVYGWAPDLARMALGWKHSNWLPRDATTWTERQRDEAAAMIEAILDPANNAWGYRLVEAQRRIVRDAAWTLDLDDVRLYYEGPETIDEYVVRDWCGRFITDLSVRHVLVDMLVEFDRNLTPDLVAQIHAQIDEEG